MQGCQLSLPRAESIPRPQSIDVHALSIPVWTYTGDFYFAQRYEGTLWFALGDVSGKGIGAAVVMAMIQEQLEEQIDACASTACDPAVTATRLDTFLRPILPGNRFASAVIGSIDDRGILRIANAGHCPALIVHPDGTIDAIDSTGPVLGMLPRARWQSMRRSLAPGDAIVAYSDGVIEAVNEAGEEFGVDRVRSALSAIVKSGLRDAVSIATALEHTVRRFAPRYGDDLTIVAVRVGSRF